MLDLLILLNNIEDTGLFKRRVCNIKSYEYEQETVSYNAVEGVTVTVNGVSTSDVFQCCIVFKDGAYYLYLQYNINADKVGRVKYAVGDIVLIGFSA